MLTLRRSEDRGLANHGWLNSRHSFSFADYYDPRHMSFGPLRVINEDRIEGGTGFGAHPHRDMEIISYVIDGALEHQDSMGNKTTIRPGEVQRMSAGTGVVHAEMNGEKDKATHFLQIWVVPETRGIKPGYDQKSFDASFADRNLVLVVSKDGREGSVSIHQDADIYLGKLKSGESVDFKPRHGRGVWLQMIKGEAKALSTGLKAGDGAAITDETRIDLTAGADAEFLIFDLPQ